MTLLILTTVASYLIASALVGCGVAWFLYLRGRLKLGVAGIAVLVLIFAALDWYWLPALSTLNAKLTIENAEVAELLGWVGSQPLENLFALGWFDLLTWVVQTLVALALAQVLLSRARAAAQQVA